MGNKPVSTQIVVRGAEKIAPAELPGHLALALRLENVGILLGAGASVSAGGMTMRKLWEDFSANHKKSLNWLKSNRFVDGADETPNIEELLSLLSLAKRDAERRNDSPKTIEEHERAVRSAVIKAAYLNENLWDDRTGKEARSLLDPYRRLLARLQGSRQPGQAAPWVFTSNYDLSIEWSAEALGIHIVNGFTGLHDRKFQPNAFDLSLQNTRAVGEARFGSYNLNLVKIHGSLNWVLNANQDPVEVPCESVANNLRGFIDDPCKLPPSNVLIQPTAAKYVDTIGFMYGELVRRFTEFLARPNTALIVCGYGFNDEHINRLLASGLLNPTLQLIVYYPEWALAEQPITNPFLENLRSLELPRIIICGGGEAAYFSRMTEDLPDPAMIDELSPEAKRLLSQLAKGIGSTKEVLDETAKEPQ